MVDEIVIATSVLAGWTALLALATIALARYVKGQNAVMREHAELMKNYVTEAQNQISVMRSDQLLRKKEIAVQSLLKRVGGNPIKAVSIDAEIKDLGLS